MEGDDDEATCEDFETVERGVTVGEPAQESPLQISMNALTWVVQFRPWKWHAISTSGSSKSLLFQVARTHNFLDVEIAKSFGCLLESIHPLSV